MVQSSMSSFADFFGTVDGMGVLLIAGVALVLLWEAVIVVCAVLATLASRKPAQKHIRHR
jgi:hypothetical protein